MQAVGNQRLRMREPADNDLRDGHHQIDGDTDPGGALRQRGALDGINRRDIGNCVGHGGLSYTSGLEF